MAVVQPAILQDMAGKQAKLHRRPPTLAFQPRGRQAGFLGANLGDRGPPRVDLVGDAVQESGACRAGGRGEDRKSALCGGTGGIDMRKRADRKRMRRPVGGGRGKGLGVAHPFARDQVFSGQHVGFLKHFAFNLQRIPRVRGS
jgi:hypothetical protein